MTPTVTLDTRFNGPPHSANGGYTCGVAADLLREHVAEGAVDGAVEVTLRNPPPLGVPLATETRPDGAVTLHNGPDPILTARPAPQAPAAAEVEPVTLADARRLAEAFAMGPYRDVHPFPTCFTCGPDRGPDDGLRIFPAAVPGRGQMVAWPWIPSPSTAVEDGLVAGPVMWAALDCPSGMARFTHGTDAWASVLGRMTTVVHRRPVPGDKLVVAGWTVAVDGRKTEAASAVWSADSDLLAAGSTLWVALSPDQLTRFTARS